MEKLFKHNFDEFIFDFKLKINNEIRKWGYKKIIESEMDDNMQELVDVFKINL